MKLLIVTQIVDSQDSNLGFFHRWIEEFAKHGENIEVICLKEGEHALPRNVHVHSLGKEAGTNRLTRVVRFYRYIFKYKNEYDAVLVHMNPEYVLLGAYFWKRWHKKIGIWYAHRSNNSKLRRAVRLVDVVCTVSNDSFAVATPKLRVMGHGIDTESFKPGIKEESTQLRIATVGRVAASKHIVEMFGLLQELYDRKENFMFTIVGEPTTTAEQAYGQKLKHMLQNAPWKNQVRFAGSMRHHELPGFVRTQDLALNFSTTGNMDKAGLEALASGVPLLSTNPQFAPLLSPYGLYVPSMHPKEAADALLAFFERPDQPAILSTLRNKVVAGHSLERLIPAIMALFR